jgi:hypothetical protein
VPSPSTSHSAVGASPGLQSDLGLSPVPCTVAEAFSGLGAWEGSEVSLHFACINRQNGRHGNGFAISDPGVQAAAFGHDERELSRLQQRRRVMATRVEE